MVQRVYKLILFSRNESNIYFFLEIGTHNRCCYHFKTILLFFVAKIRPRLFTLYIYLKIFNVNGNSVNTNFFFFKFPTVALNNKNT